jgi:hypothetical protein
VRRQSEATTALWIASAKFDLRFRFAASDLFAQPIESAVAASLCRRTPNSMLK